MTVIFRVLTSESPTMSSGHPCVVLSSWAHKNFSPVNQFDSMSPATVRSPRCMVSRIFFSHCPGFVLSLYFWDVVGNKNMELLSIILYIPKNHLRICPEKLFIKLSVKILPQHVTYCGRNCSHSKFKTKYCRYHLGFARNQCTTHSYLCDDLNIGTLVISIITGIREMI